MPPIIEAKVLAINTATKPAPPTPNALAISVFSSFLSVTRATAKLKMKAPRSSANNTSISLPSVILVAENICGACPSCEASPTPKLSI